MAADPAKARSLRILVVDDEDDLRWSLAEILTMLGHTVSSAANGRDAFDQLKVARPDLVLTDVRMPVCDGFELLELMRALPTPPVPVLFMSGYVGANDPTVAQSRQVTGFLRKPFTLEALRAALECVSPRG